MKKLITVALCSLVVIGAGAQKATVEQAKKLAGKTDKIEEARSLIQQAIANPETAGQADTYYVAGKIEWDAFNKNAQSMSINPDKVNPMDMANQLINGYNYFIQVFPLDMVPNEKGEVKPKYTKELQKKIAEKENDFFNAGGIFYNEGVYFPQAYQAFMIFGDLPDLEVLGNQRPAIPDTIRATAYFNAGLAGWSANKLDEAAVAFRKARENNYTDPNACIYEIACWQNIEQNNPERGEEAKNNIFAAAQAGYDKFGMQQPVFLNNLINSMINSDKEKEAIALVNDAINRYPDLGSLYGLRAFVYDRMGDDAAAESDYRQAAEMPGTDYETMHNVVKKLVSIGQQKWNAIELGDPNSKAKKDEIRTKYFQVAKGYAEKAKAMTENPGDMDYLIDNIDYLLTL